MWRCELLWAGDATTYRRHNIIRGRVPAAHLYPLDNGGRMDTTQEQAQLTIDGNATNIRYLKKPSTN